MKTQLTDRWLLPEGVDELLPPDAFILESLRREALDLFRSWGYELIFPPMIEYLESLLSGLGEDLSDQTLKVIDPVSGRLMGVRADITPQVARIDAHRLCVEGPSRYCYCGTVVRANPENLLKDRTQVQIGAEIFGSKAMESDLEIIELASALLTKLPLPSITIVIGHAGLFHEMTRLFKLDDEAKNQLIALMQKKSLPDLTHFLSGSALDTLSQSIIEGWAELLGGLDQLKKAKQLFSSFPSLLHCINEVEKLVFILKSRHAEINWFIDLSEMRGYQYHTGIIFSAYSLVGERVVELVKGGRYDNIGEVFGRKRPATGFSADLVQWVNLQYAHSFSLNKAIFAPAIPHEASYEHGEKYIALKLKISALRVEGESVIVALPQFDHALQSLKCNRALVWKDDAWQVVSL